MMKAVITSASHVDHRGVQVVVFDVVYQDAVVLSHTISADVDQVRGAIEAFILEYKAKALSENKLAIGQEIEV